MKAPLLKLITGNPGRRPFAPDPAASLDPAFDNGLEPPRKLRKRAQDLWDAYIRRCPWLSYLDGPKAHLWCELTAQFERDPQGMVAAKIGQLRALGSELGLDPSSRARIGAALAEQPNANDPAKKYLG